MIWGEMAIDAQEEKMLAIFKNAGLTIEAGATFSMRGEVEQFLSGCEEIINQCAVVAGVKAELQKRPDGQAIADAVREN